MTRGLKARPDHVFYPVFCAIAPVLVALWT